jgi:hypothetical protein
MKWFRATIGPASEPSHWLLQHYQEMREDGDLSEAPSDHTPSVFYRSTHSQHNVCAHCNWDISLEHPASEASSIADETRVQVLEEQLAMASAEIQALGESLTTMQDIMKRRLAEKDFQHKEMELALRRELAQRDEKLAANDITLRKHDLMHKQELSNRDETLTVQGVEIKTLQARA